MCAEMRIKMFENIISDVHKNKPLIHSITNYVSINDCANILLACGGAAIMAEDIHEVEDITSICNGLNINIGMLNENKLEAMILAGKKANSLNHPVVLDPVGAGASTFRTECALRIINEVDIDVIRGNISEIKALDKAMGGSCDSMIKNDNKGKNRAKDNEDKLNNSAKYNDDKQKNGSKGSDDEIKNNSKGVEASDIDRVTENNLSDAIHFARAFAKKINAVVSMTGVIDIVTDGNIVYCIRNGHPMMSKVTGTGCQLSALTAAYVSAVYMDVKSSIDSSMIAKAAAAAVSVMGISGEIAYARMNSLDGNASYRNYIIDAVYNMTDRKLQDMCRVEVIKYE